MTAMAAEEEECEDAEEDEGDGRSKDYSGNGARA